MKVWFHIHDMYYETVMVILKWRIENWREKARESLDIEKC